MNTRAMTTEQIRQAGVQALARELGPVGMVRFLQQFEFGRGDYSSERFEWLGPQDVQSLTDEIRNRRAAADPP